MSTGLAYWEITSIPDVDEMEITAFGDLFGGMGDTTEVLGGSGIALYVSWPNPFPNWTYPDWGIFFALSFSSYSAVAM